MTINVVVKAYGHPVKVTMTENGTETVDTIPAGTQADRDAGKTEEREYVAYVGRTILVEELVPSAATEGAK